MPPAQTHALAPSYLQSATSTAGVVAALAENRKNAKYGYLDSTYTFAPIAIESSGACGPLTMGFLRDLGNRLKLVTGEENSFKYLLQRLSPIYDYYIISNVIKLIEYFNK